MRVLFRPLVELCDRSVCTINPTDTPDKAFWYIDISAVSNTSKRITNAQKVLGKKASVRARQLVKTNDVLISTTRPNLNAVALVPQEFDDQVCSTGFCVLRCGSELDPDYLFSYVQSSSFVQPLSDLVQGALYPAVTDRQVYQQKIPWVPLEDQRRIAARLKVQLAAVEEAQTAAKFQLEEATRLFCKFREKAIEEIGQVAREPLGNLLIGIEAGKSFQTSDRIARENELGILKVSAVSWNNFNPQEAKAVDGIYQPDERHYVKNGDMLISRANTVELVGAVVRVDKDYPYRLLSDKTLRLLLDENRTLPDYLIHVMRMPEARAHIEHNATGTSDSMRNISQGTIRTIPVPLPDIKIQHQLAERYNQVESAQNELSRACRVQLQEVERLPSRLLDKAFDVVA